MSGVGYFAATLLAAAMSQSIQRTPQQHELEIRLEKAAREVNTAENWNQLAHFRFRIADYPGTLSALESSERVDPRQAYPALLRGAMAEMQLEYSDALKHYRESNDRDPERKIANAQIEALESWLQTLENVTVAHERVAQRLTVALVGWGCIVLLLLVGLRKVDPRAT